MILTDRLDVLDLIRNPVTRNEILLSEYIELMEAPEHDSSDQSTLNMVYRDLECIEDDLNSVTYELSRLKQVIEKADSDR